MLTVSAAEARLPLIRAARRYERDLFAAPVDGPPDESIEAAAGAILECEHAADVHVIADIARAWAKQQG